MSITPKEATAAGVEAYENTFHKVAAKISREWWDIIWCKAVEWAQSEAMQGNLEHGSRTLSADGYVELADVLSRAFQQAAGGKGKERHQVGGEPFTEQVMQDMARRFGVGALLGQAFKKSEESQRLPHDRAVAELLGAINYLAGAVIAMEAKAKPANDNGLTIKDCVFRNG